MRKLYTFALGLGVAVILGLGAVNDAEAKRMGGGKSFGSKPSYNRQAPDRPASEPQQATKPQQPAAQPGGAAAPARSGFMGMLGGLALGGLLGALFFGGAFDGINFFDVLILGVLAFVLYKLFAARRQPVAHAPGGGYIPPEAQPQGAAEPRAERRFDTDLLFNKGKGPVAVPRDFDTSAFLHGAKEAYARLQRAWDERDLADLRQFTTDHVFGELQDQIRERRGENSTEILDLRAELVAVRDEGSQREAAVLFEASLRERDEGAPLEPAPQTVREVWHFVRPFNSRQSTWYLDGIQQIEG